MATTVNLIRPRQDTLSHPAPKDETWWREEVGIEVEHEVWHLPQLAEEERQAQA